MTHTNMIVAALKKASTKTHGTNAWGKRHATTWAAGVPMAKMLGALAQYADNHRACFKSPLGEDRVLGLAWAAMVRGWLRLLDGELGGLDAGECDMMGRLMLSEEGYDPDGDDTED